MKMLLVLFLSATGCGLAQDFCSLKVRVVDPLGKALTGIPVSIEEANGRAESRATENGEAEFCDLGLTGVTVTAGFRCNQVLVRDVPLTWQSTRQELIVYDRAPCLVDGPPPIFPCTVLFRFRDSSENWIKDVHFDPPITRLPRLTSDSYGRAMIRMADREQIHTTAEHPGYIGERIDLECSRSLAGQSERVITLETVR